MAEPRTRKKKGEDAAVFQPPEKGTPEYDAWLDGPRPEAGNGRGQWLRARQLRGGGDASKPKAQSRTVEPSGGHAPGGEAPRTADADDLRALQHIIDAAPILSDRTRAIEAKQRILQRQQAEERGSEHGALVALRDALHELPEEERVSALGGLLGVAPLRAAAEG